MDSSNRNAPEWLNDDDEVKTMTFDESGKFVPVKELKPEKKQEPVEPETEKKVLDLPQQQQQPRVEEPTTTNKKDSESEVKTKSNEIKQEPTQQTDTQTKPVLTTPVQQLQQPQETTTSKLTLNESPDEVKLAANMLGLIENENLLLRGNKTTDPALLLSQLKMPNPELLNAVQQLKLKQQQLQQQQQQGQFQLDENLNITNQKLNKLPMNEVCLT